MSSLPASNPALPPRILIVDDEPDLRTLYELTLLREGYRVDSAADLAQARAWLDEARFDAVITDMRLTDGLGLELLRELVAQQRPDRCIVITAHGSASNAVEALKAGAFDYLTKPVDLKQFRSVVASAIAGPRAGAQGTEAPARALSEARTALPAGGGQRAEAASAVLKRLVGESPAMRAVKSRIVKVATSMAPILVSGESGTGKELVARAIHACSHRSAGPFVAVNCGAIPENLLEAEFFGARKGAYTGSTQDRLGYFQSAKGGTLFLDEIGDLPVAMQSKLLRAIQERTVRPLGSPQEDTVDVRLVSATHKDLDAEVQAGRFRQDLFYRLNVIGIMVPPLRDRLEDLPALCHSLLERISQDSDAPRLEFPGELFQQLRTHPFHGNVRELENMLHRAVALGDVSDLYPDRTGAAEGAPATDTPSIAIPESLQKFLDEHERSILTQVLQETGFNRTAAAARLGLTLRQMRYRINRLNIPMPQGSANDDIDDR
ncbi:MAG: sigma-54 dependent transcriptional regulator [Pseudomonadota bacterium]